MSTHTQSYVAAPPGELYWRHEVCPHRGAKVLLKTRGGTCVTGNWYGALGEAFTAWCPMPKDGEPPARIQDARLWDRLVFAVRLVLGVA